MLKFFLLGPPRIELDETPIDIQRRKALALLIYLAVSAKPQRRDTLATLFYPDNTQQRARAYLRRDLAVLNTNLGGDWLLADRESIELNQDTNLWSDITTFLEYCRTVQTHDHTSVTNCPDCLNTLSEAAALYSDDFLAGFTLRDSPEFDDWQFFQAESLRQDLASVLERLVQGHSAQGNYEAAIPHARRWLALDPLHEPAQRHLMQLYDRSGQPAAALRQYEEFVKLLEEELGLPPEEETTTLYEAIKARRLVEPLLRAKLQQQPDIKDRRASPSEEKSGTPIATPTRLIPTSAEFEPQQRYIAEELLVTGGQGEVYQGQDRLTGQPVVIKRLKPDLVTKDADAVARFERESEALRQLNHPNIVRMLATFEHEKQHHIVMEYVSGGSLRDRLEAESRLPPEQVLDIALELADALSRAHHRHIIHRDLKPGNVLLATDGTPRLTDFGMARLEREDVRLTRTGEILGSPAYMSPEALRGEELDARSDIWSFGVLLYEMLVGRLPFEGERITQIMSNILEKPVPDIRQFQPDIPSPLADLLQRILVKEREGRIASMRQVAAELEAVRDNKAIDKAGEQGNRGAAVISPLSPRPPDSLHPTTPLPARPFAPVDQQIGFTTSIDGTRIAYAVVGSGPPLVKVANPLTHLQYDWESPVWRHWIEALSRDHMLVRYDERGCGLSERQVTNFSVDAWVSDLEAVVDAVGLERFPIIGTSQGASIAVAYAARHPEKVSHLILHGGYARGRFHRDPTPEQLVEIETLLNLIRIGWGQDNPAFRQVFATLFVPEGSPEQHEWFCELARVTADPEIAAAMERAFYKIDVRDLARQVTTPTLVTHPRGDAMVTFEEGRLLVDLMPNAHFVPLESNNHLLLKDEPAWPQFLGEVRRFLQTDSPIASPGRWQGWQEVSSEADQPKVEQEIRFCTAPDGVRLAYATVGQGPALVRTATYLTHLEYDWNSPVWRHWLEGLAQHHTLVRYDQRGCGLSDWEVEDFSLEAGVQDLETVVDALGLDRFSLLGISQSGPVAIAYTVRHPEKVSHLILYGSYARGFLKRDPTPEQLEEAEMYLKLIKLGWGRDNPAFRQVFSTSFLPEGTPEQINWFNDLQRISTSPENAVRRDTASYDLDVTDLAPRVMVPTLVIHARNDQATPFKEGRHLATLIPNARLVTLESKNHILLASEPAWSRFLAEVYRFVGIEEP